MSFPGSNLPWLDQDRLTRWVAVVRGHASRTWVRRTTLFVATLLFAGGTVVAWRRSSVDYANLHVAPLLAVAAAVPVTVGLSAWQLRSITRSVGGSASWSASVRVVVLGALSSVLPLSSGTVVRGSAMVYWGVAFQDAARGLLYDAVLWIGISLLYTGAGAALLGKPGLAAAGLGIALLLMMLNLLVLGEGLAPRSKVEIALARASLVLVGILRLWACFYALQYPVRIAAVSILSAASSISSIFFLLPSGLGVREGATAALAVLAGLPPATAFLAAALNRIMGLAVLVVAEVIRGLWLFGGTIRD